MSLRQQRSKWTSAAARRFLQIAGGARNVNHAIAIIADRILQDVPCPPTDLAEVCGRVGIVRTRAEELPFSGELRPVDDGFELIYGRHLSKERRRFTIAHETGHALLERSGRSCPRTGQELERLCDMWAAEILMPRNVVRAFSNATISIATILELSRVFEVSLSAAALRCSELFRLSVFEASNEEIRWGFGLFKKGPLSRIHSVEVLSAVERALQGQSGELAFFHHNGIPRPHTIAFEPLPRRTPTALLLIKSLETGHHPRSISDEQS